MGVDITVYRRIAKVTDARIDEEGEAVDTNGNHIALARSFYVNPDFPGRADPIEADAVYAYEEADDVFSAGYGGYNAWREELAKLAGYPLTEHTLWGVRSEKHAAACWEGATGPFSDLINFADNEGTIGSIAAAKLAKDFADFDLRAQAIGGLFYERYSSFHRGCVLAADGGALRFS